MSGNQGCAQGAQTESHKEELVRLATRSCCARECTSCGEMGRAEYMENKLRLLLLKAAQFVPATHPLIDDIYDVMH